MAKRQSSTSLPVPLLLVADLVGFGLTGLPGALAWCAAGAFVFHAVWRWALWPLALLFPVVAAAVFLLALVTLRWMVPRPREGSFRLGPNRASMAWFCNLALSRAAEVAGLRPLLQAFYVTRFLHYRALGARLAFDVNCSITVALIDCPLITIGSGTTLGDQVLISCHNFDGGKFTARPVVIGQGVFVGAHCTVGPGTRLGDGAWVGPHNNFLENDVPARTLLRPFEWERGDPSRKGSHARGAPETRPPEPPSGDAPELRGE